MNNWLDKFRDDRPGRPGGDPRQDNPRWLDKFRDDPRARPKRPSPSPPSPARPQSIQLFAALMGVSLVLGLTATAIAYPKLAPFASPVEILLPDVLVIALIGGLVYLVAGFRQKWAVWLLAAFCLVRFVMYVPTFMSISPVTLRLLTACYFILQAAAFWFVFMTDSWAWLTGEKRP